MLIERLQYEDRRSERDERQRTQACWLAAQLAIEADQRPYGNGGAETEKDIAIGE